MDNEACSYSTSTLCVIIIANTIFLVSNVMEYKPTSFSVMKFKYIILL